MCLIIKAIRTNVGCAIGTMLIAVSAPLWAEVSSNPYQPIIERNVFALKPLPPPPPETPAQVAAPIAKVVLTGIISVLGPSKALLEISEQEQGKQPTTRKPILQQGDRDGSVEVLSIDVVNNMVRIRNGTVETNLTFEAPKATASATPSSSPGPGAVPTALPAFKLASAANNPVSAAAVPTPTIISKTPFGSAVDRSGVSLMGATTPASTAVQSAAPIASSYVNSYLGSRNSTASLGLASTVAGNAATGTIPARDVRTQTPQQNAPPIDPVTQYITMKAHEEYSKQNNIPFPPTPPMPGVDDGSGGPPAFPGLPTKK